MTIEFGRAIPTFRIFSLDKAREFYVDFLGFKVDWEHYGDATPGSTVLVHMSGIEELHRELIGKQYRHARPGLEKREWGVMQVAVTDPFGNRIVFNEPIDKSAS